jgi:hypothetical protein
MVSFMNELEQVVTRWARGARPAADLGDRVEFAGGELRLHRGGPGSDGWRVHGRLRPSGHLGRGTRVELAVTPFADRAEVALRPVRLRRIWSASHERRYFELAHDAASEVAQRLSAA